MRNFFIVFISLFLIIHIGSSQNVPNDWYYGNPGEGFMGISMQKAYDGILKDKSSRTVVVAVIDSGIDIDHEDLKENIWINAGEIPDNGIDDDKNGYIDDVYGWNFIGGPDGKNVGPDTYEATRVWAMLKYKYENANPALLNKTQKAEYDLYLRAKENVDKEVASAKNSLMQLQNVETKVMSALSTLETKLNGAELSKSTIEGVDATGSQDLAMAKNIVLQYIDGSDITTIDGIKEQISSEIKADGKRHQDKLDYAFNPDFDTRKTIVKDNYDDVNERIYGNNDVTGPDALHGTHVAGIIGAVRNNNLGMDGVADNVRLMSVRAVPDGDERDKDVANAIRYAVDNGATIINMSFGKGFGTHKQAVDEAVQYAAKKDVLLVHAAGNSAQDNDVTDNFPNANYEKKSGFLCKKKKKAANWIEVGALSYRDGEDYAATFSNYGKTQVDLFAPGVRIYSTMPGSEYAPLQGTSMAAPVVAGVAAVIRSYYPTLTAEQVKEAIMKSVTPITQEVKVPGSKTDKKKFSDMSVSGGVVNLDNALKVAATMKGKKKLKEVKA
ncbi:MAG: S8 family serine peptidase [Saprospiraceae bacterium]|nr:S8 family serine peptidase [Saprospiraceae bacterium]